MERGIRRREAEGTTATAAIIKKLQWGKFC